MGSLTVDATVMSGNRLAVNGEKTRVFKLKLMSRWAAGVWEAGASETRQVSHNQLLQHISEHTDTQHRRTTQNTKVHNQQTCWEETFKLKKYRKKESFSCVSAAHLTSGLICTCKQAQYLFVTLTFGHKSVTCTHIFILHSILTYAQAATILCVSKICYITVTSLSWQRLTMCCQCESLSSECQMQ